MGHMSEQVEPVRTSRLILAGVIPVMWVMLMWAVHLLNLEFDLGLRRYGLIPREWEGLWGILAAPLLHASSGLEHLINNSIPALVLGWCLFYFYKEMSLSVLAISWIGTGILVWIFGRESVHIGASGVVYALTGFLLVSGFMRGHKGLVALSFAVVFMYGSLVWGVLPITATNCATPNIATLARTRNAIASAIFKSLQINAAPISCGLAQHKGCA